MGWLTVIFCGGRSAASFAEGAAYFLSELNAIHMFREGNGRAQTAFLAMLAAEAGHPMDFAELDPQGWMEAMVHSFYIDPSRLEMQILALITPT